MQADNSTLPTAYSLLPTQKSRFFLHLSYLGTHYSGWQFQKNTANTLQQVFNEKLSALLREEIYCVGCGRTDAGVHAKSFYLHFDTEKEELPENFIHKINLFLPKDIVVHQVFKPSNQEANARWAALSRTYEYIICRKKDPFRQGLAGFYFMPLDIGNMQKSAEKMLLHEDYAALSKVNAQNKHELCKIMAVKWTEEDHLLKFEITANRFLRGMVRIVVGTLLEVGKGKISVEEFEQIIINKNRKAAGGAVHADGLYLVHVKYPEGLLVPVNC